MDTKHAIATDWLPRYTGAGPDELGDCILLTNFTHYLDEFATQFDCKITGKDKPMQTATNKHGLSIINFGMGSPNAATIMDLLVAKDPHAVLFLGKCGGLKRSSEIGHFILPIGAIRGDGTSEDYIVPEVPALPSFKLHKFVSESLVDRNLDYRTGVVYTTNRRLWEWDTEFKDYLTSLRAMAIDMETATIFVVGHANQIARGALLLVSDTPMTPEGVKTQKSDKLVTKKFVEMHLQIGIESMTNISEKGETIKHFSY